MASRILNGDVFDMLPTIAPGSVDCVVTSPPYWMLRSYLPKDHPLKSRELGSEKTPGEFVARMVEVFRLVRDCMAPHATCWLNMGDSYSGNGQTGRKDGGRPEKGRGWAEYDFGEKITRTAPDGMPDGNLCLIPQRLAIALQDDGWLVRSVVVWHKPAPMPASVAGWRWMRCRVKSKESDSDGTGAQWGQRNGVHKHRVPEWSDCPGCAKCRPNGGLVLRRGSWRPTSSWEPILMLAKGPGYFADGEGVKTAAKSASVQRQKYGRPNQWGHVIESMNGIEKREFEDAASYGPEHMPAGANLRDVWTIAAEPLSEKHYAAFPTELVRLCLKAGTSEKGYCRECGKPWARIIDGEQYEPEIVDPGSHKIDESRGDKTRKLNGKSEEWKRAAQIQTLGWRPTCSHETEPRPALVLDPFAGSGRTGVTAQRMFLDFVGCELNTEYQAMATRILKNDCPLFGDVA